MQRYYRIPKQGVPALEGFPAFPGGTIVRAKRPTYGQIDAPRQYQKRHNRSLYTAEFVKSAISPAKFIDRSSEGEAEGMVASHVDDDIFTGSVWFFDNVVPVMKKLEAHGKWHEETSPISSKIIQPG